MKTSPCPIVALIGRPNVGKSSLFNRLAGSKKAIVDPTPGVTRDRHYERIQFEDRAILLVDTGGIELAEARSMAALIRRQSELAMEEADILLFLMDGQEGLTREDHDIVRMIRQCGKPCFFLVNKVDSEEREQEMLPQFFELGVETLYPVSAAHGYGLRTFLDEFAASLPDEAEDNLPEDTVRIAIIGRPNVGKSSLVNRLTGEERMVVSDVPGTTRDAVDTFCERGERRYLLIDTAGIRRRGRVSDKVEKYSVVQTLAAIERCDIALVLLDVSEGITEQDTKVIGYALERDRGCIVLLNKWDLLRDDVKRQKLFREEVEMATRFVSFAPTLEISALTGRGVGKILPQVDAIFAQYAKAFTTNKLNRTLRKAVDAHSPPLYKGKKVKFFYITQLGSKPPSFIIFTNRVEGVLPPYQRYLANRFREELGMDSSPMKLVFRERPRREHG